MTVSVLRTDDLAACLLLRRQVFIDEQGVPVAEELDAYDASAIHFLACDGDVLVGTARIVLNGSIGKIGRVCVLVSHRGTGLGAALIRAALTRLRAEPGIITARLGAQTQAMGFYEQLGFTTFGPEYQDAGIPHFDMERAV